MKRPKKKVILFVVEGKTDQTALYRPIANLLEEVDPELELVFLPERGDVTSDSRHNPDNILEKINTWHFRPFFSRNAHYYPKDVIRVIHLVDTDGCFLPDENMKLWDREEQVEFPYYEPPHIFHSDLGCLYIRNEHKSENIRFLKEQTEIKVVSKTIPYEVYYFSCNMDHCLSGAGCLNISDRKKIISAEAFADANESDSSAFLTVMKEHLPVLGEPTYDNTWGFIMEENENSINRFSNLYLGLKKLIDDFTVDT